MMQEAAPYSFAVLRYVHDIVVEEFLNIGVAVYSRPFKFLRARMNNSYSRLTKAFGTVDGGHYRQMVRYLEDAVNSLGESLFPDLPISEPPGGIGECLRQVIPEDDSSLRFSGFGGGLTGDPEETLEDLYSRYVHAQLRPESAKEARSDLRVQQIFRASMSPYNVLHKTDKMRIRGRYYEHEFPWSWRNGKLSVCQPVSLDLLDADNILEKANRWLGMSISLRNGIDFRLCLILGLPSDQGLVDAYEHARGILEAMPDDHLLFSETQHAEFAELLRSEIRT